MMLLDSDRRIRWVSRSAIWVAGTDPSPCAGEDSLERTHPDDVQHLLHGLTHMRAVSSVEGSAPPCTSGSATDTGVSTAARWSWRLTSTTSWTTRIDLLVLRELMGHASPETTAGYVHLSPATIAAEYAKARRR